MIHPEITGTIGSKERSVNFSMPTVKDMDLILSQLGFQAVSKQVRITPGQTHYYNRKVIELEIWNYSRRTLAKCFGNIDREITNIILDYFDLESHPPRIYNCSNSEVRVIDATLTENTATFEINDAGLFIALKETQSAHFCPFMSAVSGVDLIILSENNIETQSMAASYYDAADIRIKVPNINGPLDIIWLSSDTDILPFHRHSVNYNGKQEMECEILPEQFIREARYVKL